MVRVELIKNSSPFLILVCGFYFDPHSNSLLQIPKIALSHELTRTLSLSKMIDSRGGEKRMLSKALSTTGIDE